MIKSSINYMCRVYNPNYDKTKFRFDVCFRKDLIFTNGKEYKSIVECTNAMAEYINKIAEYEEKHYDNAIKIDEFKYYDL